MFIEATNQTYCDPYCMVAGYQCCGCVVVNVTNDIYECYSCPGGQECIENTRAPLDYTLPFNQSTWYCASASGLAPSLYFPVMLVVSLFLLMALADSFTSTAANTLLFSKGV